MSRRDEYMRNYRAEHREEYNERHRIWRAEHREEYNERHRIWRGEHREVYNDNHREVMRKRQTKELNQRGEKKSNIRNRSNRYLFRRHSKLEGYEIHHCFTYEDYTKFIYIPRTLHIQIHKFLRDNKIPSDLDHWMVIKDLVNSCEQYTYISM